MCVPWIGVFDFREVGCAYGRGSIFKALGRCQQGILTASLQEGEGEGVERVV